MDVENYSPQIEKLFREWEQDRAMAKGRDMTGKEPACHPLVVEPKSPKQEKGRARGRVMER